jgi:hypothetical protein
MLSASIVVIVSIIALLASVLWASNLNPPPAKYAQSRAYLWYNRVVFTVGAKSTNTINVVFQLNDARGQALTAPASCMVYLSDVATGIGITATALTSTIAIGTNGAILSTPVTEKMVQVVTDATGGFDLNFVQTASPQPYYPVVLMPDGSIVVGPLFTF